ncbi:MAG: response regulator transcription factor [Clostridia bacterium]|nr:response regulator transcription factor [Clostridia bacterium]
MLNIAVCDDNVRFAKQLEQKLHELCMVRVPERIECRIIPAFTCGRDVLAYAEQHVITVLFLDIDMPGMSGFALASELAGKSPDTVIVFVSAYDEFVYSSFEYAPFRFLRKTHLDEELPGTLDKVIEKCMLDHESMPFETVDGEILLRLRDISCIEGEKNYYVVRTVSGKDYRCRGTVASVEDGLSEYDFFRVHAAYIVNLEHIQSIHDGGLLHMKNGVRIPISRRKIVAFKQAYMQYTRRRFAR